MSDGPTQVTSRAEEAQQRHDDAVATAGALIPPAKVPPRVFELTFSGTGVTVAAIFFALSLYPSLLPRSSLVQGILSGVTAVIGYGLGAGGQWLYDYLGAPKPSGRARRIILGVLIALISIGVISALWRYVGWQNSVREIFGEDPINIGAWPVILLITAIMAALLLIISRSVRLLFRTVARLLGRHLAPRLAAVLGSVLLLILIWLLASGLLVNGFFAAANGIFSTRDTTTDPGVVATQSELRSGGPGSEVSWDSLGRMGRRFVAGGPTVDDLNSFSGGQALEPVRVYVGLKSADTLQDRADLLLRELQRTGAFDRSVLLLATTTGTGWLDAAAIEPLEWAWNGDTAIAGVQYSYLPSWISLLADQEAVRETSRVVFETVHSYWSTLPDDDRPALYLYGLSLGSFGVESILTSVNMINEPIDGAFMAGPPFLNPLHKDLVDGRDEGTAPWRPIVENGRTVRFTAEQNGLDIPTAEWGPTRLVYLQHGSDPVVFFGLDLMFSSPDWLQEGQRAPDVSPTMTWAPIVTMWQVLLDLPTAGNTPPGFGHTYSPRANLESWVAITQPYDWTDADTEELGTMLTEAMADD